MLPIFSVSSAKIEAHLSLAQCLRVKVLLKSSLRFEALICQVQHVKSVRKEFFVYFA